MTQSVLPFSLEETSVCETRESALTLSILHLNCAAQKAEKPLTGHLGLWALVCSPRLDHGIVCKFHRRNIDATDKYRPSFRSVLYRERPQSAESRELEDCRTADLLLVPRRLL